MSRVRSEKCLGPITHNVLVNAFVRVFFEVFERMLRYITHRKKTRLLQPVFDVVTKQKKKLVNPGPGSVGPFINDANDIS